MTKRRQLDFVARKEAWCEYELEDGSVIKLRVMLSRAVLVEGEALEVKHPDGTIEKRPKYELNMQQVLELFPSDLAMQTLKETVK